MGEEFQSGICGGGGGGGNWWNNIPVTSKNVFSSSSPCSSVILSSDNNMGIIRGYNSPSSADEPACSISDGSIIFHDIQKPHQPPHLPENMVAGNMDSTLQMMCIGLSSSTATDWDHMHQSLLNGKGEGNYHNRMLQDDMESGNLNYGHENEDWSTPRNFMSQDSSTKSSMNHHQLGFSIPMTTNSSNSYAYNPSSTMLQNMFDTSDSSHPSPQSQFDNSNLVNYSSNNYRSKLNEISPSFPKFSSFLKSSLQQKPQNDNFSFYNTSAQIDTGPNFFPLMQPQYQSSSFEGKPSPNITRKSNNDEVDSGSVTKKIATSNEPPVKKPRIQAPSPLPTFKVRKEKLGDRITALQQLVSPFGKTDTASVLHEAIEYIKLLHDQVHVLSTPYLKNGSPLQLHQNVGDNSSSEGAKKDLRSRGLCLVPLSSTFPVAADTHTTPDYWGSTFGATSYR